MNHGFQDGAPWSYGILTSSAVTDGKTEAPSGEVACWRILLLFFVHSYNIWFRSPFLFLGTVLQRWPQQLQPLLAQDLVKDYFIFMTNLNISPTACQVKM